MATHTSSAGTPGDIRAGVRRRIIQIAIGVVLQITILFGLSGKLDWAAAWVYIIVYLGMIFFTWAVLSSRNPDLIAERGKVSENTKAWDRLLALLVSAVLPLLKLAVCALDMRFGWSAISIPGQMVGLVLVIVGNGIVSWAMISNAFFSGVVRIQTERHHRVISTGPYHYVRHPGYAGMILTSLGVPFLLGSAWGLIPAAVTIMLFIVRTDMEDRTLREELHGYSTYAKRVPTKLIPGLW